MAHETATTHWIRFFQVLTMHRSGYLGNLKTQTAVKMCDITTNKSARLLCMLPMPEGHHAERSDLAAAWISEGAL